MNFYHLYFLTICVLFGWVIRPVRPGYVPTFLERIVSFGFWFIIFPITVLMILVEGFKVLRGRV